jgi:hypothetical protein
LVALRAVVFFVRRFTRDFQRQVIPSPDLRSCFSSALIYLSQKPSITTPKQASVASRWRMSCQNPFD